MDDCAYTLEAITEALNKVGLGPQIKIITIIENQNKIK
jgi:hypothetical protein